MNISEYQGWNMDYFKKPHDRKNFFTANVVNPFKVMHEQINPTEKDLLFYLHLVNGWSHNGAQLLELGTGSGAFSLACLLAGRSLDTFENDSKQVKNVSVRVRQFLGRISRLKVQNFALFQSIHPHSAIEAIQEVNLQDPVVSKVDSGATIATSKCFHCDEQPVDPVSCKSCGIVYCKAHFEPVNEGCKVCQSGDE